MLWAHANCCRALAQERIDLRFGAGHWSSSDHYTVVILENIERSVPNRLPEISAATFGAVTSDRGAFYGFVEMLSCPNCGERVDIMLLDVRLLSLIDQTTRLLYRYIDRSEDKTLKFLPFDDAGRAAGRELLRYHVHRSPEQIVAAYRVDETCEPHRFLNALGGLAKTWVAIHETSHLGPGRSLPIVEPRFKQMSYMAKLFGAPDSRILAWAEEATADSNAYHMTHIGMSGPGRFNPKGEQRALWTAVLSSAMVYALKLIEIMQWSACPPQQGIALGRQPATARHPPTALRYRIASNEASVYTQLLSEEPSSWQSSIDALTNALDALFGVRPQWLREEETLIFARLDRIRPQIVRKPE
jgi:hypothetical protein